MKRLAAILFLAFARLATAQPTTCDVVVPMNNYARGLALNRPVAFRMADTNHAVKIGTNVVFGYNVSVTPTNGIARVTLVRGLNYCCLIQGVAPICFPLSTNDPSPSLIGDLATNGLFAMGSYAPGLQVKEGRNITLTTNGSVVTIDADATAGGITNGQTSVSLGSGFTATNAITIQSGGSSPSITLIRPNTAFGSLILNSSTQLLASVPINGTFYGDGSELYQPGSNVTFSTNGSGQVTISSTGGVGGIQFTNDVNANGNSLTNLESVVLTGPGAGYIAVQNAASNTVISANGTNGYVTATKFIGDGSALTGVNGSGIPINNGNGTNTTFTGVVSFRDTNQNFLTTLEQTTGGEFYMEPDQGSGFNIGGPLFAWGNSARDDTGTNWLGGYTIAKNFFANNGMTTNVAILVPGPLTNTLMFSGGILTNIVAGTINCYAPSISVQPSNAENITNTSISLGVTASGTSPLAFQWYFTNGAPAWGSSTSSTYSTNSTTAKTNYYYVTVSNACGMITSSVASLDWTNGTSGGGGGGSALLVETFEGSNSGYDNAGWSGIGSPDPNYTTTPPEGSESLHCTTDPSGAVYTLSASQNTMTVYFQGRSDTIPGSEQVFFILQDTAASVNVVIIQLQSSGGLKVQEGSVKSASTVDGISAGVNYYFKLTWDKASAGATLEFSTTTTFTGSGNKFTSITGDDSTHQVKIVAPYKTGTQSTVYDNIKVYATDQGNYP